MLPVLGGACIRQCLPSMAPTQFGIFHFSKNPSIIVFHCVSVGQHTYSGNNTLHIVWHVSSIIFKVVDSPSLYDNAIDNAISPVARYLNINNINLYSESNF